MLTIFPLILTVWSGATLFIKPIALSLSKSICTKKDGPHLELLWIFFQWQCFWWHIYASAHILQFLSVICTFETVGILFFFSFLEESKPLTLFPPITGIEVKKFGFLVHRVLNRWKTMYVAFHLLGLFGLWPLQWRHIQQANQCM